MLQSKRVTLQLTCDVVFSLLEVIGSSCHMLEVAMQLLCKLLGDIADGEVVLVLLQEVVT